MELTQKYLLKRFSLNFYSSIAEKYTNCISFMVLLADGIHETSTQVEKRLVPASQKPLLCPSQPLLTLSLHNHCPEPYPSALELYRNRFVSVSGFFPSLLHW